MTKNLIISFLSLVTFCVTPLFAQESCYEQYLREHNKKILTAEDADDSYDEQKKTVLAKQMYGDSYLLKVETIAQRAMITKVDGTYIADVHVALVDSTWYMWLSVDPLADKYIHQSPYLYCSGNPVMLIDPDGRDWFYCLDETGTRTYTYDENVFSQEDLNAMNIDGTYAGMTASYNNTYYGLFGFEYTDNNDKIFARRMDRFLIGEAMNNQSGENFHMSFVIPGLKNGQSMEFNYAGGIVLYSQVEKNTLHLEDWGGKWSNNKDFMTNKGFSGYVIRLENNKGYDPVNIIYKDKSQQEHIHDLFIKTLFRRTAF